jgi:hypothetical protein
MLLLHGDCNEMMKELPDDSVDLIFTDLPYGQVSCDWDKKIDLSLMWEQFMRVKKLHTPIFFCCSTKFGVELITSAPKDCPFRYDIVWVKSAPCGFLCAKKMPMKKHEMLYVFYEKLPFYDLSSHTHKFAKETTAKKNNGPCFFSTTDPDAVVVKHKYDPPLPVSVQNEGGLYGKEWKAGHQGKDIWKVPHTDEAGVVHRSAYKPPLPTSVQKESDSIYNNKGKSMTPIKTHPGGTSKNNQPRYDPPLPTSVQKEEGAGMIAGDNLYSKDALYRAPAGKYNPPLPVSVQKEGGKPDLYGMGSGKKAELETRGELRTPIYDPPLPNTILEIKSQRGKHSTQKPLDLMKWVLKYYSKEGDVVLDPTMGSGSTGVACKEMNRDFVGMEMNPEIYEVAVNRIEVEN